MWPANDRIEVTEAIVVARVLRTSAFGKNRVMSPALRARTWIVVPSPPLSTRETQTSSSVSVHSFRNGKGKALLDGPEYALCTCDKGLAMFWCALNPDRGSVIEEGDGFRFDFSLDRGLFPGLNNDGLNRLSNRIRG